MIIDALPYDKLEFKKCIFNGIFIIVISHKKGKKEKHSLKKVRNEVGITDMNLEFS